VQRELALLSGDAHRRVIAIYGGTGYGATRQALARGVDTVVACPGRLEDLVAQGAINLGSVHTVVVDEADRMADMGFLPSVRRLLDGTAPGRQVMLFSATMGPEVESLVSRYQTDPARHDVVDDDSDSSDVSHLFWRVPRQERVSATAALVREHGRVLVFCRTRRGADRVTKQLNTGGVKALAIHGGKTQTQREKALAAFDDGRAGALVATDVAARGIHVADMPCVVHYDPAADRIDYMHRSGRTGRAGKTGVVVSLVADEELAAVRVLQRALGFETVTQAWAASRSPGNGRSATKMTAAVLSVSEQPADGAVVDRLRTPSVKPRGRSSKMPAVSRIQRPPRLGHRGVHRPTGTPVGTVRFFDAKKGYGFLSRPGGAGDVFVHASNIQGGGPPILRPGQQVQFEMTIGRKGDEACNVMVI
jgi:superfamily II DNA/RNA helicase/cold shock CspA family protein